MQKYHPPIEKYPLYCIQYYIHECSSAHLLQQQALLVSKFLHLFSLFVNGLLVFSLHSLRTEREEEGWMWGKVREASSNMNLCSHGTIERCNMYLPFIQGCFRSFDPLRVLINGGHDLWHEQWRGGDVWWHSLLRWSSHLLRPYYNNS